MSSKKQERNFLKARDGCGSPDLGRLVAEQDPNLQDYYVAPERYVSRAQNINDPAVFFVGPKGIGKSAVLQMVRLLRKADADRIINILPDDLAFTSLANVETNTPILAQAGRNQGLFKSLWDYILALEVLRREYTTEMSIVQYLTAFLRPQHEKQARTLIALSVGGAPQSLSERILQLIKEIEIAGEIHGAKISGTVTLTTPQQSAGNQLNLLSLVNSVAKHVADNLKHPYYILIDDLDLHWYDSPLQNAFIAALFLSLRHFSKPPNLKCVVAIKDEIYRHLPLADRDKFHDWVCRVTWDGPSVKKMIEQRLVAKLDCTPRDVWGQVFPKNGFDKIWRHTNGKPREAIRLASFCVEEARSRDHLRVSDEDIVSGMREFSDERRTDLAKEYQFQYEGLELVTHKFAGWPKEFPVSKLSEVAEMITIEVGLAERHSARYKWAAGFDNDLKGFARILLECGFFQIKVSRTAAAKPYDLDSPEQLTDETYLAINPMYAPGLGLVGA